jgi:hypothetical protein
VEAERIEGVGDGAAVEGGQPRHRGGAGAGPTAAHVHVAKAMPVPVPAGVR